MNENLVLKVTDLGITQNAESCRLTAYPDPGTGGAPWTIFWGHTGPEVHPGMTGTQEQADAQLLVDMASAEAAVRRLVKIELSQEEFIALCDFVFNVGAGNFGSSTMLKLLNEGNVDAAALEFGKWNKGGGRVLQGLVTRRSAEMAEFLLGLKEV